MPCFKCNILQGVSITGLFQVCLVVSQNLGEGALIQMFCWYAREKWRNQFSLVACEDCLAVCFEGLVVGRICVWCLVIAAIFMEFGQAGAKRCGGCLKVINWAGVPTEVTKRVAQGMNAIGKTGSQYVIMLYCKTLLHIFLGIYCKKIYWIPIFTILLLFYVFQVGKAKSTTQSVLIILILNGFLQKNFQIFYFISENFIPLTLHASPLCLFAFFITVFLL